MEHKAATVAMTTGPSQKVRTTPTITQLTHESLLCSLAGAGALGVGLTVVECFVPELPVLGCSGISPSLVIEGIGADAILVLVGRIPVVEMVFTGGAVVMAALRIRPAAVSGRWHQKENASKYHKEAPQGSSPPFVGYYFQSITRW